MVTANADSGETVTPRPIAPTAADAALGTVIGIIDLVAGVRAVMKRLLLSRPQRAGRVRGAFASNDHFRSGGAGEGAGALQL
jgi:hypothetical protein